MKMQTTNYIPMTVSHRSYKMDIKNRRANARLLIMGAIYIDTVTKDVRLSVRYIDR